MPVWSYSTENVYGEQAQPLVSNGIIDVANAKWKVPLTDYMQWGGMLVTNGGLLFSGKQTGEFVALGADSGKMLWQHQTGSAINAPAVTFTHKGRQYVSVSSARGGGAPNIHGELREAIPMGGIVWTFALMPE